jgi:hypothetical protein
MKTMPVPRSGWRHDQQPWEPNDGRGFQSSSSDFGASFGTPARAQHQHDGELRELAGWPMRDAGDGEPALHARAVPAPEPTQRITRQPDAEPVETDGHPSTSRTDARNSAYAATSDRTNQPS